MRGVIGLTAMAVMALPACAEGPSSITLPPGFHATEVASGLKGIRHLAMRDDHTLYVSTRGVPGAGILAMRLDAEYKATEIQHFGDVVDGSGLRFHGRALYASSPTAIYRFAMTRALVPSAPPVTIVSGMLGNGFLNRPIAFDGAGRLVVSMGGMGNICTGPATPPAKPVGSDPCPDLATRSGVWAFDARKADQHFPADGDRLATGLRDMVALDWRPGDAIYGVMHGRNGTAATWPDTHQDEDAIAEEMHRIVMGANLGWPYTYYDHVRKQRIVAPEYGGDGKAQPKPGLYSTPAATFAGHSAPLDILFYSGRQFPRSYRGGAFVAFHGGNGKTDDQNGYDIAFVPFDRSGRAGDPTVFADGFSGPGRINRSPAHAEYRPIGLAQAPDGSLYVADSTKGTIWRISYAR